MAAAAVVPGAPAGAKIDPPVPTFLSCDWGSSVFRLRALRREPHGVLAETSSDSGIATLRERIAQEGLEPGDVFRSTLSAGIGTLAASCAGGAPPVLISGMASSSIGWKEVEYARTPFPADGSGARVEALPPLATAWAPLRLLLVSGLRTDRDVMRGEETQLVGLLDPADRSEVRRDGLVVLPGTHSKHVRVRDGNIVDFQTFITGELYALLARQSILRYSVVAGGALDEAAFLEGVCRARARGLGGSLFGIRTNQLLESWEGSANASCLSGILIGSELCELLRDELSGARILLAAGAALRRPYALALGALGLESNVEAVSVEEAEGATARGHAVLLRRLEGVDP